MQQIRKNDVVVVLTGKDRGKSGLVLDISTKHKKVKVQGVGIVTRHLRARKQGESSQLKRMESFIDVSNVMLFDQKANRPCRTKAQWIDGVKKRVSSLTKEII